MGKSSLDAMAGALQSDLQSYTQQIEMLRASKIIYQVLQDETVDLNMPQHPVVKAINIHSQLLDLHGFLTIVILDLSVLVKNMLVSKDKWEVNQYTRQAMLLIFESLRTYNEYGKILNEIITRSYPELAKTHSKIITKIRNFKKKHHLNSKMAMIRNNTVGHINPDFLAYCNLVSKIDSKKSLRCSFDYLKLVKEMEALQFQIFQSSTNRILALNGKALHEYPPPTKSVLLTVQKKLPKLLK